MGTAGGRRDPEGDLAVGGRRETQALWKPLPGMGRTLPTSRGVGPPKAVGPGPWGLQPLLVIPALVLWASTWKPEVDLGKWVLLDWR